MSRREFIKGATAAGVYASLAGLTPAEADSPEGMICVPSGKFIMGLSRVEVKKLSKRYNVDPSWLADTLPRREVELPTFHIDKFPVTNREFYKFVLETGAEWLFGRNNPLPGHLESLPAVMVPHNVAVDYAKWVGKRLPTEEEWEKAARGERGLLYPWGNMFELGRCSCSISRSGGGTPCPVDGYPQGASPYGVMDMCGNAAEWTSTKYDGLSMVVKGGSYKHSAAFVFLAAYRSISQWGSNVQDYIGFRCARDA